jgi:hypothetical protein
MNFHLSLSQKLDQNNPYFERLKKKSKKKIFANISQVLCFPIAHNRLGLVVVLREVYFEAKCVQARDVRRP